MKINYKNLLLEDSTSKRDHIVDMQKGIAVLAVVAAHCGFPLLLWINPSTFFLVTFCIIAGFYLNTRNSLFCFLKDKFFRLIIPYYKYFAICALLALIHDKFVECPTKIFPTTFFSFRNIFIEPLTMAHQFMLISPLWFLTTLFEGFVIISFLRPFLVWLSRSLRWSLCAILFFSMICQILIELPLRNIYVFGARAVIFALFVGIGFLAWQHREIWIRSWVLFLVSFCFLFFVWRFNPSYIVSYNYYGININKHLFVVCNLTGFIFSYLLTKILYDNKVLLWFLQYCGIHSFTIMALHITGFIIMILVEKIFFLKTDGCLFQTIPSGSGVQRILLFFAGVLFPLLICIFNDLFFKKKTRSI